MNAKRPVDFGAVAAQYKTFRPTYPPELFEWLASISPGRELAWDCATGNGQAAVAIKPYFKRVIATDVSEKQIAEAVVMEGVEYSVSPADIVVNYGDKPLIRVTSVDLIMVAQALHWFDLQNFFLEVRRVANPNAILACWCYSLLTIDPAIDEILKRLYYEIVGPFWSSERKLVDEHYANIRFPFEEITPPGFSMTQSLNLAQLVGYLGTWSAVGAYQQAKGANPIELIADELASAWGDGDEKKTITWPLHLRVGRVHVSD